MHGQIQKSPGGIQEVRAGGGKPFSVAGVNFLWKAKGEDTQNAFTIVEQTLLPGEGVPPHSHPYTEFFYVLDGVAVFHLVSSEAGGGREIRCTAGDAVIVSPETVHAFYSADGAPARILGVSNYLHQTFFDGVEHVDATEPFGKMDPGEAMAKIARIGREHSMFFAPPPEG